MARVYRILSKRKITQLQQLGFTVTIAGGPRETDEPLDTITDGTDSLLKKLVGAGTFRWLKLCAIRA